MLIKLSSSPLFFTVLLTTLVVQSNAQIAPEITVGPTGRIVSAGATTTFSVTATGTAPLAYQWTKNRVNIAGATNATHTIPNAQLTDVARYGVWVSNASGVDAYYASLFILPTGSFNGSDAFSTARNTGLWGVNEIAEPDAALTESGGKLVLSGTASTANGFQVSAGRVWQTGLAPFGTDWTVEVEVTVPNAVFTGANQKAKWELSVVNAADLNDFLDLRLQSSAANGQFVRSETTINRLDGPSLTSAVGVGETVRLRMTWTASTKQMQLAWFAGAVSNYLGSHNLGAGSQTEFANCPGFMLGLIGETEGMSPLGLLVADNFTTTPSTAALAPVITSATTFSAPVGQSFSYQITAHNAPTSFGATGLPPGLSVNTASGLISGTPTAAGSSTVTLSAINASGTGTQTLTLTLTPPIPAINSPATATATVGQSFTYQITANNTPTSFGALNLPTGLIVNAATGLISGSPIAAGTNTITLSAGNAGGVGTQVLTLVVNPPVPVITSSATAGATVGQSFTYQITANNTPTSFGATGLPAGLTVSTGSGQISGTPTAAGTFTVALSAANAGGTGTLALTLAVSATPPAAPEISAAPIDQLVSAGSAVTFTVTATGTAPLAYQWSKNGVNIVGATNNTHSVNNAQLADAARYSVVVSNGGGAETEGAFLAIRPTGVFAGSDTFSGARNQSLWGANDFATAGSALSESGGKLTLTGTANAANDNEVSGVRAWQSGLAPFASDWAAEVDVTIPNAVFTGSAGLTSAKWELNAHNAGDLRDKLELHFEAFASAGAVTSRFVRARLDVDGNEGLPGNAVQSASLSLGDSVRLRLVWNAATQSLSVAYVDGGVTNVLGSFTLGSGTFQFANCTGFLITLSGETGDTSPVATMVADNFTTTQPTPAVTPVITSAATATATAGQPFSYQITAINTPTSFNATGLPAGLSVNTASGVISGTPTAAGTSVITLSASNAGGTGTQTLTVTANPPAPLIASAATATATVGQSFTYTITANNSPTSFNATGLPSGISVNTGTGLISGTPAAAGTSTVTLSASNAGGTGNQTLMLTVSRQEQSITFGALGSKTFGAVPFTVSATASSALPVTFSIASGPATMSGNTVTITGAGTVTVRASQAGNATFNAATSVEQTFTVTRANQTVTFGALGSKAVNAPAFAVSATTSSGLTPSFSIVSGPATISGNTITLSGAVGTVVVRAAQGGNANFNAATPVDQSFGVGKLDQTITFGALGSKTFGDAAFAVNASASSSLPVTFSIASGPASISGNTITLTGAGTVTVRASQTGDATYNAAAFVDQSFTVAKANQSLTFGALGNKGASDPAFTVSATASSGLPPSFSIVSGPATVSGNTITLAGTAGTVVVRASQGGNANYNAASPVDRSFTVSATPPAAPVITSAATATATVGQAFSYTITANNSPTAFNATGLPAGLTVNTGTGLISGTPTATGTSTVTLSASNAGGMGNQTVTLTVGNPSMLLQGLVAYYPFSGNANDESGNGNHGTVNGATLTANRLSQPASSYTFDDFSGQYIAVPHSASISPTNEVTVSAWIRPMAYEDNKHCVSKGNHVNYFNRSYSVQGPWADGKWRAALSTPTGEVVTASGNNATLGQWSHVLMTYDRAAVKLYVNGQLSGTQPATGLITQIDAGLILGSHSGGDYYFNGGIDDVRIFSRALSAAEVVQLHASEVGIPTITVQPSGVIANVGGVASFDVSASGSSPLSYQWLKEGVNLSGATTATLSLSNVQTNQAGNYSVVITNAAGSVTSSVVVLTVNRLAQTITFGALPGKQVGDAPFVLAATASSGLTVSYASSSPSVAAVTGNTVTIAGVGTTTVTASQAGNATYLPASSVSQSLTVTGSAPAISLPPTGQSFHQGGALTLGVTVSGSAPLFYQWQFNGANIPGANGPTLALINLTATNAGAYRVVVTNSVGTITSLAADVFFFGDLKFIAATVLAGSIGQQYRVDYADVVTIGTTNWLTLTNVTLPYSPFLVIDPNSAGRTQRYYRAVPLP